MSELFANSQVVRRASALLAAFAASACLGGCPFVNESHCAYMLDKGMDSPCGADQVCNKCTADNNGCISLDQMGDVLEGCVVGISGSTSTTMPSTTVEPTGPTSSTTETSGTTVMDTSTTTEPSTVTDSSGGSTETTTTTDPSTGSTTSEPVCDPDEGLIDGDCTPPNPYCVGVGKCGPCTALGDIMKSCADVDPAKTVCHEASGLCVECTQQDTSACPNDKPGCDEETGACSKCTEHSQCPNTACDLQEGVCFPDDAVVWVENTQAKCVGGLGTELKPFCSLTQAKAALLPNKPTTIKIRPGQLSGMTPLTLTEEGFVLAIVRGTATIPTLDGANNGDPMVLVSPGSRVYLSNLRISNTNGSAILECSGAAKGAKLYLDDLQVSGNGVLPAKGIDANNCATQVRRSRIYRNKGGLQITGGSLIVENSHVSENGSGSTSFGAFNFLGGATGTITYSSIAMHPTTTTTSTFNCNNAGAIKVRNSAVVGPAPLGLMKCPSLTVDMGMTQEAATKVEADAVAKEWFLGPTEGVLRAKVVMNAGPLKDKAMWVEGDPRYDFDREARPTESPSWAGADEPQ